MFASLNGLLLSFVLQFIGSYSKVHAFSSIAFYYGRKVDVQQLSHFDIVVVVPGSDVNPESVTGKTKYYAYTSVGEVGSFQDYYKDIPEEWILGENTVWGSKVIDQAAAGWPDFFVSRAVTPLWDRGFRGFFLDTLDSYQLYVHTPEKRALQQAGIVSVIRAIKEKYSSANLIFNRGFELMPQVHNVTYALAFESLYQTWDEEHKRYGAVSTEDRNWLLNKIRNIRQSYPSFPIISIDYCDPANTACSTSAVSNIRRHGLIPYVADGHLQTVGKN